MPDISRPRGRSLRKQRTVNPPIVPAPYNFLYSSSRPALRAAAYGGRPRVGNDTTVTGQRTSPSTADDPVAEASNSPHVSGRLDRPGSVARLLRSWWRTGGEPPRCRNGVRPAVRASGGHGRGAPGCRLRPRWARRTAGTRRPIRP